MELFRLENVIEASFEMYELTCFKPLFWMSGPLRVCERPLHKNHREDDEDDVQKSNAHGEN